MLTAKACQKRLGLTKKAQGWGYRVIHCDNKSGFDNLQAHHLPYGYYFQALFLLQPGKKNN